jgi:hypothetical protein
MTDPALSTTKLWIDDRRVPPDPSWCWVKSVEDAIALMRTKEVEEASLDDDLGQDPTGTLLPLGRTLVDWMVEADCWPSTAISVHSQNVSGVRYMEGMIEQHGPFQQVGNSLRFIKI